MGPYSRAEFLNENALFFSTERDIFGVIDVYAGDLLWKRSTEDNIVDIKLNDFGILVLTNGISNRGKGHLSFYGLENGSLLWTHKIDSMPLTTAITGVKYPEAVLFESTGRIRRFELPDGHEYEQSRDEFLDVSGSILNIETCPSKLRIISQEGSEVTESEFKTKVPGKIYAKSYNISEFSEDHLLALDGAILVNDYLYYRVNDTWDVKCVGDPNNCDIHKRKNYAPIPLNSHKKEELSSFIINSDEYLGYYNSCAYQKFPALEKDENMKKLFSSGIENLGVITYNTGTPQFTLRILSSNSGNIDYLFNLDRNFFEKYGEISNFVFHTYESNVYVYFGTLDGSVHMSINGSVKWTREEYLTSIQDHAFVHLPSKINSDPNESQNSIFNSPRPIEYMQNLIHKFKYILRMGLDQEDVEAREILATDHFGFNKLLILGTQSGSMAALSTLNGSIVWKNFNPNIIITNVEVLDKKSGNTLILAGTSKFDSSLTMVWNLNAHTGKPLQDNVEYTTYRNIKSIKVVDVHSANTDIKILLLIDDDEVVHVHNKLIDLSDDEIESAVTKTYFYKSNHLNEISGYAIVKDGQKYILKNTWNINVPEGEEIILMSNPRIDEPVGSPAYLDQNRKAYYKCLSRSIFSFVTSDLRGSSPSRNRGENENVGSYILHIADGVSGVIHHRIAYTGLSQTSANSKKPNLFQMDNWMIFQFWNDGLKNKIDGTTDFENEFLAKVADRMQRRRDTYSPYVPSYSHRMGYEVTVHEMYESNTDSGGGDDKYIHYQNQKINLVSQSYVIPFSAQAIGSTSTKHGITTKEIVFALPTNQLYGINKTVLDAKRTKDKHSLGYRDSTLMPYSPLLEFNPRQLYGEGVIAGGIKHIHSTPTFLESTSIVCSWGLDLVCTPRTPSGSFDRINSLFNHTLLILAITLLLIATFSTKTLAKKSQLKRYCE